jgi:murein DD-endopeptidase MepM/ murein hydrolase activator NlpD
MEYDVYTIARGDTLSKIAQQYGTDADQLARINGISEPNYIYPGQKIKIPKKTSSQTGDEDFYSELWIRFVDAVGKPIADLATRIVTSAGEHHFTTDDMGLVPAVRTVQADDKPHVFVAKIGGGEKKVATLNAPRGTHQHTLRSPKQLVRTTLRRHEGLPGHDPAKPIKLEPGQTQDNRDLAGNPIINVGVECPNKDNLRLGPNSKYRSYVIGAAARANVQPQAVAAIMNAEAAKLTVSQTKPVFANGKPVKNKDGSPKTKTVRTSTGEWDPASAAKTSSARGMTQFLDGTWIGLAVTRGTFINQKLIAAGLIEQGPKGNMFQLSNGTSVSATRETLMKHVHSRATADDANIQSVLDMRFDPESAIYTAVDYALQNTEMLQNMGFQYNYLNDSDKAKIMYLTHHLGPKDVVLFIRNEISEVSAKHSFTLQVGATTAARFAKDNDEEYKKGQRDGLNGFINGHITNKVFSCDPSSIPEGRSLLDITDDLAAGCTEKKQR